MRRFVPLLCLVVLGTPAPAGAASPAVHPVVAGFERFHAGGADPLRGGRLLLSELNCTSCHKADADAGGKQAPVLDHLAARVRVGHLRRFLRDPQAVKPGTTMPALFAGDPRQDDKVEALVHFLASGGGVRHERPDSKAAAVGRDLYHKVGCVACHGPRDAAGNPDGLTDGPQAGCVPLGDLTGKYSVPSLAAFLAEPHAVRPSGRMPKLLSGKEPRDVAQFLLQGLKPRETAGRGATHYAYYEGEWDRLPDFTKLKPAAAGTGPAFDLGAAKRSDRFGMVFTGVFPVEQEGDYAFTLTSDDGSRLEIDGKMVVDNDGVHAGQPRTGRVRLARGIHTVRVAYFEAGGEESLDVRVQAAGLGDVDFGPLVAAREEDLRRPAAAAQPADEDALAVQPALVEQGKQLFASAGCAACHQRTEGGQPLASTVAAPALTSLKGNGGCLAPTPAAGRPWYALAGVQRQALAAALRQPAPARPEPAEAIARTLTTFNCYACHVRGTVGGPAEALNRFFQTTQPEMGDEGRVPPPLDGVGAKLTAEYLRQVLDKGAHDRPYMHTRMPGFGLANVGAAAAAFAALDRVPATPEVAFQEPLTKVKSTGRHLVGGQAFGCVKCHTFAGRRAEGVQGIDMVLMPRRLQRDWFHAYVSDPQRTRPGTRMPSAFTKGESVLANVFDGRAPTQVEAIWLYLQDGPRARLPVGVERESIVLTPTAGAVLYRNFIEGAGPRAIGVGYPEKVNAAFDANDLRLALIWRGGFIDAARHWTDRGAGFEGPLGDDVLTLPPGSSFAVVPGPDAPWPTAPARTRGQRFLGYRLAADDRPTFLYAVGDVRVEDEPAVAAGPSPSLRRTLTVTAKEPVAGLYYRAAAGSKIEPAADGWYKVDGTARVKVQADEPVRLRTIGGRAELLVPVRVRNGQVRIVQEYAW